MLGAGARTRRHVPTTSVAAEGYLRVPGRGQHAGTSVRTKARGANDGAGLARCKWTAHGHGNAAAIEGSGSTSKKEATQRGKNDKKQKAKTAATTQLGLETGMQFETQPLAAARLIGRGRQPLQPVQRHRGAVVRPKQRTSSLKKPCRALPSRVATLQSPLQKALPGRGGAAGPAIHQSPLPAAPVVLDRTAGFLGLKYGCRRLDSASSRQRRGRWETTEKGKSQRERICPCFCIRGGAPMCRRCVSARGIITSAMQRSSLVPALLYDLQPAQHEGRV